MTYEKYLDFSRDELLEKVRAVMSPKRFSHVLGVEQAAIALAEKYGYDTEKAGLPYVLPYLTDRNSTACYCGLHGIQNHSDTADSYDAKWSQLSKRAFLPDHSGKWVLFLELPELPVW